MAMWKWWVPVVAWLLPLVGAEYICSRNSTVLESFAFDFLRTFQRTGVIVKRWTIVMPKRMMNVTLASKDTRRTVTMWSACDTNTTEKALCPNCIGILINNIYELCCEQRSSWGTINLRSDCSLGYSAPDYVIQGWTDPGDLPRGILKEPKPVDFDAAHTIFRSRKPYLVSLPVLLFTTFFGMH